MPHASTTEGSKFPNFPVLKIGKDKKTVNVLTINPELNRNITYLIKAMKGTKLTEKNPVNKGENITVREAAKYIAGSGLGKTGEMSDSFVFAMPESFDPETGKFSETLVHIDSVTRGALMDYIGLVVGMDNVLKPAEDTALNLAKDNAAKISAFTSINPEPVYKTSTGRAKRSSGNVAVV